MKRFSVHGIGPRVIANVVGKLMSIPMSAAIKNWSSRIGGEKEKELGKLTISAHRAGMAYQIAKSYAGIATAKHSSPSIDYGQFSQVNISRKIPRLPKSDCCKLGLMLHCYMLHL